MDARSHIEPGRVSSRLFLGRELCNFNSCDWLVKIHCVAMKIQGLNNQIPGTKNSSLRTKNSSHLISKAKIKFWNKEQSHVGEEEEKKNS